MSEISEATWYAGWMRDLEFTLWAALCGKAAEGRLKLTSLQISDLKALSRACNGWILFHDDTEETFVPLPEWETKFAEWSAREGSESRPLP